MKGEILFEKMTGISDEYIAEAALVTPVTAESGKKRRGASLSTAWRRGLSAACICIVAVIALLAATAGVGRVAIPAPEGTPPLARFGFTYELRGFDGTAMPGDTVCVDTTIINRGLPFVYHGSSASYHPEAYFVLQGNESISMQCTFMETCDSGPHAVAMGMEGGGYGEITIPADAIPGVYDLVLSYKGTTQVYKGVLTVGETEGETYPPISTDHAFSFGYEAADTVVQPGGRTSISCWTVNDGAAFTYTGYPDKYAPTAYLIHSETGDMISGKPAPVDYEERKKVTVKAGDIAGKASYMFSIPANATTGEYDLELSYGGASQKFEGVLTVAVPTVIDPAVLYNLTMPIGSEWLYEPIDEAYVDGDLVTVRMRYAADMDALFLLNGEVITSEVGDSQLGYWEYTFEMPKKDSEIIFRPYDRTTSYSDILEAYYKANHAAIDVDIRDYGTYGDGVRVATIEDVRFEYPDMVVEHRIGPAVIRYGYSNFLQVLHNGQFCSLSEAYEARLLSDADMAALENRQRELYPFLYADDE